MSSKSKFNCLWHHVWLLWATRHPGRDSGLQRTPTNSLFSLTASSDLLTFNRDPALSPCHYLQMQHFTSRELLSPAFACFCCAKPGEATLSLLAYWPVSSSVDWQGHGLNSPYAREQQDKPRPRLLTLAVTVTDLLGSSNSWCMCTCPKMHTVSSSVKAQTGFVWKVGR